MLITFWVAAGWFGVAFRTGSATRRAAGLVAACRLLDGFAVGWNARSDCRCVLVALVTAGGWRLEAGG